MKPSVLLVRALLCGGATIFCADASAQKIPALEAVNLALPDLPRAALETRRATLVSTRGELRARFDKYQSRCLLQETPQAVRECPGEKTSFQADMEAHIIATKSFNWDLEQETGGYRLSLENRLKELDDGLARDAVAVQRLGFKRRAQDFDDLVRLSTEAHRLAFQKIADVLVDEGGPLLVEGVIGKLRELRATGLGPDEARALLRQFDDANLVNPKARAYLREVARGATPGAEAKLAGAVQEDLQQFRDLNAAGKAGDNKEAALKLMQWIAPPGSGIMEIAVWVGYDVTAQTLVSGTVETLSTVSGDQLKGLSAIMCLSQRRLAEKHEAGLKLAALQGKPFDRPVPVINPSCRKPA